MAEDFQILAPLAGGALIGLASALVLLMMGRIVGISGMIGNLFNPPPKSEVFWRVAFIAGLLVGGVVMVAVMPSAFPTGPVRPMAWTVAAGLLVGFGTRLGNGCTSGHGVCGMGRLSLRSTSAVLTFMATGALTVYVARVALGG